ncbi:MAG: response regulator transcription factor [Mycobacterium sp.]
MPRLSGEQIVIIDDCTLFRESLIAVLVLNGFPPPRGTWDLPSLVQALADGETRIVLVNMATRGRDLLLRAALEMNRNLRAIVLGASERDESAMIACAEAGVFGYHLRTDSIVALIDLIHAVAEGPPSCPPGVAATLLRRLPALAAKPRQPESDLALTNREIQIMRLLELGRSNRDIAAQLGIAVHTVKNHIHNLLAKLGVGSRREAAALAKAIHLDHTSLRKN